jgi:hypothetical protein
MKRSTLPLVTRHASLVTALTFAVLTANAGVKYWDNPDFRAYDVGDYVQDGLVVNYDGIRNQGPNKPHDSSATNWVSCAHPSTYIMTRYSLVSGAWTNNNATGAWTDNGFVFNKDAIFHDMTSITIEKTYTIQTLVNATGGEQSGIGYIMCDYNDNKDPLPKVHPGNWAGCSMGIRTSAGGGTPNNSFYLVSNNRPYFAASSGTELFSYATAIHNHAEGVMFAGTKAPWGATDGSYRSDLKDEVYVRDWGISLGGHYPRTDEHLKGTLKNFRLYSKCLSDEEVAWNRVVDEARYFHRRSAIPVTNVVVATTIPGMENDHFALDAEGYTFSAPVQRTVKGKRYVLGGYTLETWNGSAWVADGEGTHTGDSVALSNTATKVRLTWQYSRPTGEGQLAHYDVSDYVSGALLHFDGIFNQGTDKEHDPVASTWKNLGSEDFDLTLKNSPGTVLARPVDASMWVDDGFVYAGNVRFGNNTARTWGPNYTVQVLAGATRASLKNKGGANYIFATAWAKCALSYYGQAARGLELHTQNAASGSPHYGPYLPSESLTYVTATLDSSDDSATIFTGTSIPSGTGLSNVTNYSFSVNSYSEGMNLGGWGGGGNTGASFFVGTIKNFRFYGRVLTEAELEQNRKVDEYRFFGRYADPNVIVQSTYAYLEGYDPCGDYEVDGSYTFVAPETVVAANGITYACDGYTVETWDGTKWTGATVGTGNAYSYNTTAGTVRLTWRWKGTQGLRSAANYRFEDYATGGLKVHLDGLFNAGVDKPRTTANTTNTKWVNLGSNGADSDAKLTKGSDSSTWTDDGYSFGGKSKFVIANVGVKTNSSYTVQLLSDVDRSVQQTTDQHHYLYSGVYNMFAVSVWGHGKPYLRAGVQADVGFNLADGEHLTYFTGIMDQNGVSPVAYVFPGTSPASGTTSTAAGLTTPTVNNPGLGGWGGGTSQYLIGTIKNFRYYDRVLTDEELIRNRQVDSVRYFDALAVTNLVVELEEGMDFNATPAPGAYFVEGSYELTVAPGADTPTRYKLHDWDATNGEWVNPRTVNGTTLNFSVANATAAKMKVTWCKTKAFMLIVR